MRWLSIASSGSPRLALRDVEIEGETIRRGLVVFNLPTASRDPAVVDDPVRFDITPDGPPHVAFGHGVHHCLGAPRWRARRCASPSPPCRSGTPSTAWSAGPWRGERGPI